MNVLRVAWYRLTVTLRRRWAGYLGLVLITGLTGGVALSAAAAAGRTESSFPVFLASTNPSDLTVQYSEASASAGLPLVRRASPRASRWHPWRASTACTSIRTGSASSPGGWPIRPAVTRS